jgi:hypothetical protein
LKFAARRARAILRASLAPGGRASSETRAFVGARTTAFSCRRGRERTLALPVGEVAHFAVALEVAATSRLATGIGHIVEVAPEGGAVRNPALALRSRWQRAPASPVKLFHVTFLGRLGDADTDSTSLKGRSRKIKSLLQTVNSLKFNVTKTLRALCQLVLHNTDVRDTALGEELRDIIGSRIKREVSDMGRIRGLGGQGEWLSQRIAAVVEATTSTESSRRSGRWATVESEAGRGRSSRQRHVLHLVSPRAKVLVGQEVPEGHLLGLLLSGRHDCGLFENGKRAKGVLARASQEIE